MAQRRLAEIAGVSSLMGGGFAILAIAIIFCSRILTAFDNSSDYIRCER